MLRLRKYTTKALTIGIRKEGKNRWERRVPLVPDQVERLVNELGSKVIIQPSTKRVIPDAKYIAAGAIVQEDLSQADVILGVKEVPINDLIPNKTYMYFSHTHKGQHYNMPMLKSVMDKKIRLLDYELLTDEHGKRLVQFSKFAGYAGMIDGLHSLGLRLLALGLGNPFLAIGMSYMYRAVADARLDVTRTGQVIMDDGLPKQLGPMIFVITGDGNVSRGALHVFKCLPHEWVKAEDLEALSKKKDFDNHKVYICQARPKDFIVDKDGKFDHDDYIGNPQKYKSVFHEKIAPYARLILNGIFWTDKYPRLMTIEQTKQLAQNDNLKLLTLADVSCDINGSFEFMGESSTIDSPYFMYDPITKKTHDDIEGKGIQIMSIDNLPTEMPLEASEFFSEALFPVVAQMAKNNFTHPVLTRASITDSDGKLVGKHEKLAKFVEKHAHATVVDPKKVLLLGSGFVAKPLVDFLLRNKGYSVTIASNMKQEALRLSDNRPNAPVVPLDVSNKQQLGELVKSHDIVVSFVPATLHPIVAEECLKFKKNLVTASYISPAMQALNDRARQAGLTFMNEVGLDPGIDHLTACQMFDHVKNQGGKITSFVSWCGGLPAPEVSNNPLGYKFSWSPKGVLLAGLNSAKFKRDGKFMEIPGSELLANAIDVPIFKGYAFEGLANRDSLHYIDTYQLDPEHIETMFRGTLRYKGYSELMHMLSRIGLLDTTPRNDVSGSWGDLLERLVNNKPGYGLNVSNEQLKRLESAINWLSLNSKEAQVKPSPTVLDAFCDLLQNKLVYAEGERDMVAMHHEFGIKWSNGSKEKRMSTMIAYGEPAGYSAMAKTVGLPAAIATEMILKGGIKQAGVIAPMSSDVYEPMIVKLEKEGIKFVESVEQQ
ncbi:hypothetical protein HDV01_007743 [Terramyces sp. JEL0728]|nr:hypothetical protein HDV01_007743 [Terramyces sp. JEL0728]